MPVGGTTMTGVETRPAFLNENSTVGEEGRRDGQPRDVEVLLAVEADARARLRRQRELTALDGGAGEGHGRAGGRGDRGAEQGVGVAGVDDGCR